MAPSTITHPLYVHISRQQLQHKRETKASVLKLMGILQYSVL